MQIECRAGIKPIICALAVALVHAGTAASAQMTVEEKFLLSTVALKKLCIGALPHLKDKIEAHFFSDAKVGLGLKIGEELAALENSKDPRAQGRIEGAMAAMAQDKSALQEGCKVFTESK
jgi:hypothetical protein